MNAYILAADPAWVEASVLSYYDIVERIVVSYDRNSVGYTGKKIDVETCLTRLRAIDRDGKMDFRPGEFAVGPYSPMELETRQRMTAISQSADGADWIVQLDSDEVLTAPALLLECVAEAERSGFSTVDYPSLWLYCHMGESRFLAWCRRGGRVDVTFPGSMVVRPDVVCKFGRRSSAPTYRVDVQPTRRIDGVAKKSHRVVRMDQSIVHLSMLRSDDQLRAKFATWSHSRDRNWDGELFAWRAARRYPRTAAVMSQLDMTTRGRFVWPITLDDRAMRLLEVSPEDLRNMRSPERSSGFADWLYANFRGWIKPSIDRGTSAVGRRLQRIVGWDRS